MQALIMALVGLVFGSLYGHSGATGAGDPLLVVEVIGARPGMWEAAMLVNTGA